MRRGQLLRGRGGREGALQVHRLVEQFVTDKDDQGKEAELEVAAIVFGKKTAMLLSIKSFFSPFYVEQNRKMLTRV